MTSGSRRATFFLRLVPMSSRVDEVRRLVGTFCASARAGAAREQQLALAAGDLVQDAFDHGDGSEVDLEVEVDGSAGRARLAVTSAVPPDGAEALRIRIARVQDQDAAGRHPAATPVAHLGVGLSRVRFEGQLELAMECHGDRVTVRAEGPLACDTLRALAG